jgi:hypothetical protein
MGWLVGEVVAWPVVVKKMVAGVFQTSARGGEEADETVRAGWCRVAHATEERGMLERWTKSE